MERKNLFVLFVVFFFCLSTIPVFAIDWQIIYQCDFSSDPGWLTNSPSNFYWDSSSQNYYFKMWDTGEQYAYVNIPYSVDVSYRFEFDVYMTRCDWAGDFRLGLGDSDMDNYNPSTWWTTYHRQDYGENITGLCFWDSEGGWFFGGDPYIANFSLFTWYRNIMVYDADAKTLSLTIYKVSDGSLVGSMTRSGVGSFQGIDRIYISSLYDNYRPGATGEGYFDNIMLYEGTSSIDEDNDGYFSDVDCNDKDASVYPGAPELCDGKDNDCDYVVPSDEVDIDEDGFLACSDCNDSDPLINQNAIELPGNYVDENCDGEFGDCYPCLAWRNHGEYLRCVAHSVELLVNQNIITEEQGDIMVSTAANSDVGKKDFVPPGCQ